MSDYIGVVEERVSNPVWVLVDDCTHSKSSIFEMEMGPMSKPIAVREGINQWLALSEHDRKLRDGFQIVHMAKDDDDCWDYNTGDDSVDIKELWEQISDVPEVWADSLEKWLEELNK